MKAKQFILSLAFMGLAGIGARAQAPFPIQTAEFAKNATEVTRVSLDKSMLQFAAKFMAGGGPQDQAAQNIINHLDGIYVRDYTYASSGAYSLAAVEAMRSQLRSHGWKPMVTERGKASGENTDIFVREKNGQIDGMFVIDAEPRELAFVHIAGPIKPGDLSVLSGHFGVPPVQDEKHKAKKGTQQ